MLAQLLTRSLRRWRPSIGWSAFVLVIAAVWTVALGVMDADWADGDILFAHVTQVSALLVVILAHTRLPGRWGALILGGAGLLYVGNSVAHFLPPLFDALRELEEGATWLVLRLWQPDLSPPTFPLWGEGGVRLATFGERLASWSIALVNGESERNPVAFLFVSGLIMWGSTAWAVWGIVRRREPLLAMLPLGVALSMSTYLSGAHVGYLISFVVCVTLLLPIIHLTRQERRWEREGIDYSPEIRFDVWQLALAVVIVVLILAIVTPSFSIPRLVHAFWKFVSRPQQAIEDLLIRFFGGVEPSPPPQLPVKGAGGGGGRGGYVDASLPNAHLLGGNPALTAQVVMHVCTDTPPPIPDDLFLEEIPVGPKYYWKGITYDTFRGRRWSNGPNLRSTVPAYEPVVESIVTPTLALKQRYLIEVPHGRSLYAAVEPYVVDQQVESRRRVPDDLVSLEGATNDYVVDSWVPQATARQLMSVPQTYAPYVTDRYLQLSDDLPQRVRALALEIVQGADSAYEKAVAIERYLRQFPYDLNVPTAPLERDVVDYFLFDVQRGYCDYYASSFVVLARAAGVPARLAVGYAMGTYDLNRGCYRVVEMDAHSWPEVYFAEYGWIPFEPTAAFRTFERPQDPVQVSSRIPSVRPIPKRPWYVTAREWWRRVHRDWTTYVAIAGGVVLLALLIVSGEHTRQRQRLLPVQGIALCYEELSRMGRRLGTARRPHDTPAEYASVLASAIRARVARWPWSNRKLAPALEEAGRGVRDISRAYERASYSPLPMARSYRGRVDRLWRRLQRQLWWLRFVSWRPSAR